MPIQVKCPCGKALKIPDAMAGKAVKCPGCGKAIKVPAVRGGVATKGAASTAKPAAAAAPSGGNDLGDLFDEEGFSSEVSAVCPACRAEMPANGVLCTKCGFNKETGEALAAHLTAGVDIDAGTLALQRAEVDMVRDNALQKEMLKGPGMPWWMLALVLFVVISGVTIAVLSVNAANRIDESVNFNAMGMFLLLVGSGLSVIAGGAYLMIIVHAFKQDTTKGLLSVFVPVLYPIFHVFKHAKATWKFLAVLILTAGAAAGCFASISRYGGL